MQLITFVYRNITAWFSSFRFSLSSRYIHLFVNLSSYKALLLYSFCFSLSSRQLPLFDQLTFCLNCNVSCFLFSPVASFDLWKSSFSKLSLCWHNLLFQDKYTWNGEGQDLRQEEWKVKHVVYSKRLHTKNKPVYCLLRCKKITRGKQCRTPSCITYLTRLVIKIKARIDCKQKKNTRKPKRSTLHRLLWHAKTAVKTFKPVRLG